MRTFEITPEIGVPVLPLIVGKLPAGSKPEEASASGLDSLLYLLLDSLLQVMEAERGSVMFLDRDRGELFIRAARGLKAEVVAQARSKLDESLAGKAVLDLKPIVIRRRQVAAELKPFLTQPGLKASLILPLQMNGNAFGTVNLATQGRADVFSRGERVRLTTALVERAAPLVAQFISFEAKEKELAQLRKLLLASKELTSRTEPRVGFELICTIARETLGVDGCIIALLDRGNGARKAVPRLAEELKGHIFSSLEITDKLREGISIELNSGTAAAALRSSNCVLAEDLVQESSYRNSALLESRIRCVASLPLRSEDSLLGVMLFVDSSPGGISLNDLSLASSAAAVASSFAATTLSFRELEEQTFSDSLTRTAAKGYFLSRLDEELLRAKRSERALSLIVVDIDNFKGYNDSFGHLAGDEILALVANLIKVQLRASDLVGRFGGDEFMVLLPEVEIKAAAEVAERVRVAIANLGLTRLAKRPLALTASFGVACTPVKSVDAARLIHLADKAMYLSKRQGGNQVTVAREADF